MCEQGLPKIYLITPPVIDINVFPDQLASILDAHEIACVRLALATASEDTISRAADICRDIAHKRDVAIVLATIPVFQNGWDWTGYIWKILLNLFEMLEKCLVLTP